MTAARAVAPLTLLHVTAPAPVGGLESVVRALAGGHAAMGHRVHVVSIFDAGAAGRPLAEGVPGVTTHLIEIPRRRYWRERAAVAALARDVGADVVHTHGSRPDVVDGPVGRALGAPAVSTVHGFTGGGRKNRFFEWLQTRAYRRFDAVVAVSSPQVERLVRSGVPARRVHLIRNAWAPGPSVMERAPGRDRLGLPPTGSVVGWVGRLSREKGPDVFVECLDLLGSDAPTAAFVGDGAQAAALMGRCAALGLEGRVRFCGRVDGAASLLRAFDCIVLSSRTEGTPIVLFEAMAAGVPIVATAVGGVPDVVSPAEAILVPPDDPAALAGAISSLLADPAAAAARADAARARLAKEFAAEPWLREYDALYRELLAERRGLRR